MNILQGVNGGIEKFGYIGIAFEMKRELMYDENWVLRDLHGNYIDHDVYRYDLADRNGLKLEEDA